MRGYLSVGKAVTLFTIHYELQLCVQAGHLK